MLTSKHDIKIWLAFSFRYTIVGFLAFLTLLVGYSFSIDVITLAGLTTLLYCLWGAYTNMVKALRASNAWCRDGFYHAFINVLIGLSGYTFGMVIMHEVITGSANTANGFGGVLALLTIIISGVYTAAHSDQLRAVSITMVTLPTNL